MPAEHQQVQRYRVAAVELTGPPQNVAVGIAVEPAVEKLVTGGQPVEQASPASSGAEHNRIAPHHRLLAFGIDRVALEPDFVGLENDRTGLIDKDEVRPQGGLFPIV